MAYQFGVNLGEDTCSMNRGCSERKSRKTCRYTARILAATLQPGSPCAFTESLPHECHQLSRTPPNGFCLEGVSRSTRMNMQLWRHAPLLVPETRGEPGAISAPLIHQLDSHALSPAYDRGQAYVAKSLA